MTSKRKKKVIKCRKNREADKTKHVREEERDLYNTCELPEEPEYERS